MNWKQIIINYLHERDSGMCSWCGKFINLDNEAVDIDHVLPFKINTDSSIQNLRLLHTSCHRNRHKTGGELAEPEMKVHLWNNPKPKSFLRKTKGEIDYKILGRLKEEYQKDRSIPLACVRIGMSYRQARYLINKYKLPSKPDLWDLKIPQDTTQG